MPESFDEASSMVVKMLSPLEDITPFKLGQIQKIIETLYEPLGKVLAPAFAVLQVLFLLAWLGYFVWGIVALCLDSGAISCDCADHYWIWLYALLVIVIPTSMGAILGCVRAGLMASKLDEQLPSIAMSLPTPLVLFFFALQGFIIWHDMPSDCEDFYGENHMQLLVLFRIQVFLMCIGFFVGVFTLFAQVSVKKYDSIDDKSVDRKV
mmetsp:Transcript_28049/g.56841  ORF Transcript_28049/g.56841 Transcript_28049/m.56841 type:complete len:208 (-) Transcript_28049:52-675(-)